MSLLGTLNTGASGLGNSSTRLSVIGDNIANMGTTGFKGMRSSFSDMMPSSMGGIGGSSQMGRGATLASTMSVFGQGGLKSSDSALDFAISGEGFFPVSDGDETYYTRDGTFFMDNEGYLTNSAGMNLQGTLASDGELTGLQGDLQLDRTAVAPKSTETISIDLLLSAETEISTDDYLNTATFDGTTTTGTDLEDIAEALGEGADATGYTSSVTIY
ncbi:MAG: flagellar hook protein FlgE, partial [Cognaticolwellia sp.]